MIQGALRSVLEVAADSMDTLGRVARRTHGQAMDQHDALVAEWQGKWDEY